MLLSKRNCVTETSGWHRLRSTPLWGPQRQCLRPRDELLVELEGPSAREGSYSTALTQTSFSSCKETKELPTLRSAMDAVTVT